MSFGPEGHTFYNPNIPIVKTSLIKMDRHWVNIYLITSNMSVVRYKLLDSTSIYKRLDIRTDASNLQI